MGETSYAGYASAAGSLAQFVAQLKAASDARTVARYNARVAEANAQASAYAAESEAAQQRRGAIIARQEITIAQQAQAFQERQQREQFSRLNGQTEAIIAASGLALEGSPLVAYEANIRQQEWDVLAGQYNLRLRERALGEEITQREYAAQVAEVTGGDRLRVGRMQAGLLRSEGEQAFTGGLLRAAGTATEGVARAEYLNERRQYRGLLTTTRADS